MQQNIKDKPVMLTTIEFMKRIKWPLALCLLFLVPAQHSFSQDCGTRQLDRRVVMFLKLTGYKDQTLEELRATPIAKLKYTGVPVLPYPKEDVRRIKITADSIPVLVFNPLHESNLPIIINYHGGGFISPLIPALEPLLWQDAKTYGAIVFAVDYRVAPEYKFPTAVNDSYNAFVWITKHGSEFGGETNRIILMGNSAGANLVAVTTQKAKKNRMANKIKLQVMNGLPGDMSPQNMESSGSYRQNANGYFLSKPYCYFTVETYAPGIKNNPELSPILSDNLSGLPPAVIINAEFDPLRDDGIKYAAKLRKAGVKVWDKCFAGQIHMLLGLPPDAREIREFEMMVKNAMQESF